MIFQKPCMRRSIRIYQTVHAEISVMDFFLMIAAIKIHCFSVFRLPFIDCMITPFPYKSTAKRRILVNHLKIVFQIPGTIPHRMTVFDQKKRLIRSFLHIFLNLFQLRIHSAVKINIGVIISSPVTFIKSTFITSQPGRIKFLCPLQRFFKCTSVSTFIAHGPDYNTGTIFLSVHAKPGAVHRRRNKRRMIRNPFIPSFADIFPTGIFQIL